MPVTTFSIDKETLMFARKLAPEFKTEDLPAAATFLSNVKHPTLRVRLIPVEEEAVPGTNRTRKIADAVEIRFKGHLYKTKNRKIFERLMTHSAFNKSGAGYTIDQHDPTGFWRAMGRVEAVPVQTFKVIPVKPENKFDPKKFNPKTLAEKLPENPEALAAVL